MIVGINKNLDREIVRALRGRRASMALSQMLGYTFNQVYLWESGRRQITWKDFVKVCAKLNRPLEASIGRYLIPPEAPTELSEIASRSLRSYKKKDIASRIGISASTLSRWINGQANPPLKKVLQLLFATQLNTCEFLDEVVGEGKLSSLQTTIRYHRSLRKLFGSEPLAAVITPALNLHEYLTLRDHVPGILSKKLGISKEKEAQLLELLLQMGQVEKRTGKYVPQSYQMNVRQDREIFLRNVQFWAEAAARFPKKTAVQSAFGYRVFGASDQGVKKIRQAQVDYYNALTEIIREERGPFDHVVVVNFQTLVLDEISPGILTKEK